MPQLNVILDEATAKLIRQTAKERGVSISHYLNNLIQRALILEENSEDITALLKQPKFVSAFKKMFEFNIENLALMKYIVKNLGDESSETTNQQMLEKARTHAKSYVSGIFEE